LDVTVEKPPHLEELELPDTTARPSAGPELVDTEGTFPEPSADIQEARTSLSPGQPSTEGKRLPQPWANEAFLWEFQKRFPTGKASGWKRAETSLRPAEKDYERSIDVEEEEEEEVDDGEEADMMALDDGEEGDVTELIFRLDRKGIGWGEEILPSLTVEHRPVKKRRDRNRSSMPRPWAVSGPFPSPWLALPLVVRASTECIPAARLV
jgi:hypothetical protein